MNSSRSHKRQPETDHSALGRFETAPAMRDAQKVSFVWAADLAWQGWGRNPDLSIVDTSGETITCGEDDWDAWAQAVHGREVQLRKLLRFIKEEGIENVLFITADVHFAAAISYQAERATAEQVALDPFWEFAIGPVHAGAFGPNALDTSFGPGFEYVRGPATENLSQNLPPPNLQTFGHDEVSEDGRFTVRIHDIDGSVLYEKVLEPQNRSVTVV
jgi:phosphodiesterase/alkaline phosphatase D-like protein